MVLCNPYRQDSFILCYESVSLALHGVMELVYAEAGHLFRVIHNNISL